MLFLLLSLFTYPQQFYEKYSFLKTDFLPETVYLFIFSPSFRNYFVHFARVSVYLYNYIKLRYDVDSILYLLHMNIAWICMSSNMHVFLVDVFMTLNNFFIILKLPIRKKKNTDNNSNIAHISPRLIWLHKFFFMIT